MSELCLKDKTVLTIKDVGGVMTEIESVDAPELLPLCLTPELTMDDLNSWLKKRGIPDNREGLASSKEEFGVLWMQSKNYASLTDQYWIKRRNENWKKINFFNNIYSTDIGDIAFKPWSVTKKHPSPNSPDLCTNGVLRKRWVQKPDKTSSLVKAGSTAARQDPLYEVLVSVLCEQLEIIPYVKYDLCIEGLMMCCSCDNFITEDTDLVPLSYIYNKDDKGKDETVFDYVIRLCDKYEVPGMEDFLKGVIAIDSFTGNEDRNLGNIALIRDINTMKFVGPAPLFDSGNAYWFSRNVNISKKSKLFGDVEAKIFNEIRKKCDVESLSKDYGYVDIISNYPEIKQDDKRESLIAEIKKRNNRLLKTMQIDANGR